MGGVISQRAIAILTVLRFTRQRANEIGRSSGDVVLNTSGCIVLYCRNYQVQTDIVQQCESIYTTIGALTAARRVRRVALEVDSLAYTRKIQPVSSTDINQIKQHAVHGNLD